jgi:DNA-binding PadR family transcriptional regulator
MADKRFLFSGLVKLHILHSACNESIYGASISEELSRHGYRLSTGTLYPLLHGLEKKGYLRSRLQRNGKQSRRLYEVTAEGREALAAARVKVQELFGELFEHDAEFESAGATGHRLVRRPS